MSAPRAPGDPRSVPFGRRKFLAGAAALGAGLATAGCGATYNVASGLTGSSVGANRSTLVYWNLLTGGDGSHMHAMEAAYTKAYPGVDLQLTILTWGIRTTPSCPWPSGRAAPDVAMMHLGRIHQYGPPGMLTPLSPDLLAAHVFLLAQRQIVEGVAGTGLK